uniref:Uncharacterized protein n=1 Tax=Panagrolaimus sp. ES5 TaxID=591445 RepID=A0AC34GRZ3_9BILA
MLKFLTDIGLILGTFLDPTPTMPKARYPREGNPLGSGLSDINTESNNVKELFGYEMPQNPSEQLLKFVDLSNAAYLSYVFGSRVAFNTVTKDDAEYYFGAVTDTSLNFLVNDSATPSSCTMEYIYSVLDLKVYGSRAILKIFDYLNDEGDDPPQEVISYGTYVIDFLRATYHQNCSKSSGDVSQTSESLYRVRQFSTFIRKNALKAFDEAHEENLATKNVSEIFPQSLLFDTISSGVLYHYYTLLYVIGETEFKANKSSAIYYYSAYATKFLKLGKLITKKRTLADKETIINAYAKITSSTFQFTLNLLEFLYLPTTDNKNKITDTAKTLGGDVFTLIEMMKKKQLYTFKRINKVNYTLIATTTPENVLEHILMSIGTILTSN